ncbi:diguanylate cyclase domain-containing protein [Phaeovulum sp.]|uniref:GGDEF domain-containing protein n=1 Tax=Phaeovulum sp. TaxID=2934796 RepID=UPI0039E3DF58
MLPTQSGIMMSATAIGQLMPLCLWVSGEGDIRAAGPTMTKLMGMADPVGQKFTEHFELRSTWQMRVGQVQAVQDMVGRRLNLALQRDAATLLRGIGVPAESGGVFMNLSFGVGLAEAVRKYELTNADFAASDLAMELLYLQEAKAAVMGEWRALNERLQVAHRAVEAQAMTDPLTGLANRRAFDSALQMAIDQIARDGPEFALAHLDLDRFKAVNDTLGHAAGDRVLTLVAKVLLDETRRGDLVARIGGDEFVLILRGPNSSDRLDALGERIIARLENSCTLADRQTGVSASIGMVMSTSYAAPDPQTMLADADAALYASKRLGRARCTIVYKTPARVKNRAAYLDEKGPPGTVPAGAAPTFPATGEPLARS